MCSASIRKLKEANLQFLNRVKKLQQVVNSKLTSIEKAEAPQEESHQDI